MGSYIVFNDSTHADPKVCLQIEFKKNKEFTKRQEALENKENEEGLWTMYFDGSISKEGVGVCVWIISPNRDFKAYSYKMTFECTNNVVEYESLLLVLHALKYLVEKRIEAFGDSELVVNQVNDSYQTKHPRMRAYRNEFWDILEIILQKIKSD